MTIMEQSSATICTYNLLQKYYRNENELTGTAIFRFLYTMNYNMFNNIVEINGKISKATIQKVLHKSEFHLYNHRKSNYRRNVYVFLVYRMELSYLINSGNAHGLCSLVPRSVIWANQPLGPFLIDLFLPPIGRHLVRIVSPDFSSGLIGF